MTAFVFRFTKLWYQKFGEYIKNYPEKMDLVGRKGHVFYSMYTNVFYV